MNCIMNINEVKILNWSKLNMKAYTYGQPYVCSTNYFTMFGLDL